MTFIHDETFWTDCADYQKLAHGFTGRYAASAWEHARVPSGSSVLDIACGAGALALVAARDGARVLATDFSSGMVEAVRAQGIPSIDARVMDGQALDLPDGGFDAAFSMFGIMLFPDWRAGLTEMARVLRPGGVGCLGTWQDRAGAATNLLLAQLCAVLFPELAPDEPVAGMNALREPGRLEAEMIAVGFGEISILAVSHDFIVDAEGLGEPDRLFQFSPLWPELDALQRHAVMASLEAAIAARGGTLPVPSPALIARGVRT